MLYHKVKNKQNKKGRGYIIYLFRRKAKTKDNGDIT